MAIGSLSKEFKFYRDHQDAMVEKYNGKVIALKNCEVLGVYATHLAAFTEVVQQHERGTFVIQRVSEGTEAYTATFYSPLVSPA